MSKTMRKCVQLIETRKELIAESDKAEKELISRHEAELNDYRSRAEEKLAKYDSSSDEILRRIVNTAEVIRNVVHKKFDYLSGKKFLEDSLLTWVETAGRGVYSLSAETAADKKTARVISIHEGAEYLTVKIGTTNNVKTWWIPNGFLTSSTWDVAKQTRAKIYRYKLSQKELKVKEIAKELKKAKKEYERHSDNVSALTAKLNKASKKLSERATQSINKQ